MMRLPDSRFRILNITHSNTISAHTHQQLLYLYNFTSLHPNLRSPLLSTLSTSIHGEFLLTSTPTSPHLLLDYPFSIRHKKVFCRKTAILLSNLGITAKKEEQAVLQPSATVTLKMIPDQTTQAGVDHTGPQSQTMQPQEPHIRAPQDPEPQNQEAQTTGATDAPQPSQPTQTAADEIVMQCCDKTRENMRDCECRVPRGPCVTPPFLFTHYSVTCFCYSCKWLRATKTSNIRSRIPGQEDLEVENPAYNGNGAHTVLDREAGFHTTLEAVHPVLLRDKPRQQWEWVYVPIGEYSLPFVMSSSYCAGVLNVTMSSNGGWRAIRANGTSFHICSDRRPRNELYSDYGYAPGCSPFDPNHKGGILPLDPAVVNPPGYVAPKPPNKSREYSADRDNKTLFIGSIDCSLSTQEIRELFLNFGEITYVNKPHQSNAFVQFARRRDAQMAMRQMQGVPIKNCRLRISWGDPKTRVQSDIKVKNSWTPYKGHKYQHIQTKEKPQHADQNDWHPQSNPYGGFDMSGPWAQQRLYQMAYAPHYSMVWHPPQWYQYPYQQQMGYGYQHPYPPPPPPPVPSTEQNPQPALPEIIPSKHESRLDASVATWVPPSTENQKTQGPLVVSSDMASHIYQQQGPVPRPDSTSSLESDQSKASSGAGQSRETTGKTSPGDEPRPTGDSETVMDIAGELDTRLQELTISTPKIHDTN